MREFVLFAVIRVALFLALWWVLHLIGLGILLAGLAAAVIGMLISIIALAPLREKVAQRWAAADERRRERRGGDRRDADADEEDSLLYGGGSGDRS